MKNQIEDSTSKKLSRWLVLHSFIVIAAAVLSFIFVETAANYSWTSDDGNNVLFHAMGVVIPMAAMLGVLNYYLSKWMYRYVNTLTYGIEKIANGDFEIKLDEKSAGPFSEVYENFNKMSTELQNVHTLHDDFINNYSHEFKTPITSINGFAALLLETDVAVEDKERYLKIIVEESERLAKMANSTILLSKLNAQQIVFDKKLYSLDEQMRQCVILLSLEWTHKEIDISCNLESVMFNGNKELMKHLWINLLNNAIKFTTKHGKITVTLSESGEKITIQISDTGKGMNSEVVSNIFDQYYQGEIAHSDCGLGLGLSIVKRIVELCNGEIGVKSVENEGSTFTVTLSKLGGTSSRNEQIRSRISIPY